MKSASKADPRGRRYSEKEKQAVVEFVVARGRGGITAASKQFGVTPLTVSKWCQQAGVRVGRPAEISADELTKLCREIAAVSDKIATLEKAHAAKVRPLYKKRDDLCKRAGIGQNGKGPSK